MKISTEDIENMVLAVFAELRVPPEGKLHHATLVKYWQQFRFRNRDLSLALSQLIRSGIITTENSTDDLVLVLTYTGHARAENNVRRGVDGWLQALRLSWLALQRRREASESRVRRPNRRLGRSTDRDSDQLNARAARRMHADRGGSSGL